MREVRLPDGLRRPSTVGLLIVLAVLVLYLPAVTFATFHFDDLHHIRDNPAVRELANIPRFYVQPELWSNDSHGAMYRPTLMVVHTLDFALWQAVRGNGYWAGGWVLTNLLLHALASILVWRIALRVGLSQAAAVVAGAVMAVHPIFSEVVNYPSSRSESVAAVLMLSALLLHLRGRARDASRPYVCFAGALLLSMLSMTAKETTVGFFAAVALLELLGVPGAAAGSGDPESEGWAVRLRRAAAFAALYGVGLALVLYVRGRALSHVIAPLSLVETHEGADPQVGGGRSLVDNWMTQSRVVVLYLQLWLKPVRLSVDHDVAIVQHLRPGVLAAVGIHLGLLGAAVWAAVRGARIVPLCAGWFWILIAPSVVIPLNVVMNEHRLYLPGLALAVLSGAGLTRAAAALRGRVPPGLAIALPLVLLSVLTVDRTLEWRDEHVLWTKAVERSPLSARAHMHLGAVHHRAGLLAPREERVALIDRALASYQRAAELHEGWYDLQMNMGSAYLERGRVTRDPADFAASLAAYTRMGEIVGPERERPRFLRAVALAELERYDAAIAELQLLADADDSLTTIYLEPLARTYRRKGDKALAAETMEKVITIEEPLDRVHGLLALGWWYFEDGDLRRSESYLSRALEIAERTKDFKPYLYVARFLRLVGEPGADTFEESARKLGWTANPDEAAWVLGGATPGVATGTQGLTRPRSD